MQNPNRFRLLVFAAFTVLLTGCPDDPATTVTIVVNGEPDGTIQAVCETLLPTLADSEHGFASSLVRWGGGNRTTLQVSPVRDMDAFAKRINFGSVTRKQGRRLFVDLDRDQALRSIYFVRTVRWVEDLPENLRLYWFMGRCRAIAFLNNEPYSSVFWRELFRNGQAEAGRSR